jgi:hypothetical protein
MTVVTGSWTVRGLEVTRDWHGPFVRIRLIGGIEMVPIGERDWTEFLDLIRSDRCSLSTGGSR